MNERKQLWLILEAAIVCLIFAACWAIGGSGDFWYGQKWIRRFLGPGIFGLWAFFRSGFDWRYFIQMGLMMGASTLPYGADNTWTKIFLRFSSGAAIGTASSVVNIWYKKWLIVGIHIFACIFFSIMFGVFNPLEAMWEQFILGFIYCFIPAMCVRKKS